MSTRKILVVDDSKSARFALRMLLKRHQYEVELAESGEEALQKVEQIAPDAVFMDHLMPGMNGFEALDALKQNPATAAIPVVMCTSNDDASYLREARAHGALDILPKPASEDKLRQVLGEIEAAPGLEVSAPASEAPAAASAPAPGAPTVEPTPAAPPTPSPEAIDRRIRALFEEEFAPALQTWAEARARELSADAVRDSAQSFAERMEQAIEGLRAEISTVSSDQDVATRVEAEMSRLKDDLMQMETSHAQMVMQKIRKKVLPGLIQQEVRGLEERVFERLNRRLGALISELGERLPQNAQLMRKLSEVAEAAAEQKAEEIARREARTVAEHVAEETAGEVADNLTHSAGGALNRMYLLAGGAALLGILAAAGVYLLLS